MNPHGVRMLPQEVDLGFHIVANPLGVAQNLAWKCRHERKQKFPQNELWSLYFSLERNSWSSLFFSVDSNSIKTISWS
jgi:hypothetical protein